MDDDAAWPDTATALFINTVRQYPVLFYAVPTTFLSSGSKASNAPSCFLFKIHGLAYIFLSLAR